MTILKILPYFKGVLHFINETYQMGERTRYLRYGSQEGLIIRLAGEYVGGS
jgi:hypothetical protein